MKAVDRSLRLELDAAACLLLDCDGVIFDSNGFKLRAMQQVLQDSPAPLLEEMSRYWRNNGGMSRRRKFEHFFGTLVGTPDWQAASERAVAEFSIRSLDGYREVEPIGDALELARHAGRERVFVVSGADQQELVEVFRLKGIEGLFADVLGAPRKKLELVAEVLARTGASPERTLFVGDGARDFEACQKLGIHFIYLARYSDWDEAEATLSAAPGVSWANDWPELLSAFGIE